MEQIAHYIYQVYKEQSFSAAAKKLYISQPALSASITRFEKKMGFRIFDRTKLPLSLTPQGRIYIRSIEEIMESESNMRRRIRELSDMSYGSLSIGGSSYSSYFIMADICSAFYKKFPEIRVRLDIGNVGSSDILWEKLKSDEIDVLFTYNNVSRQYIAQPLLTERLVIAMHKDLPGAEKLKPLALTRQDIITKQYAPQQEIEDLSIFGDIEFIAHQRNSITGQRMAQMLGDFKVAPYTIENARHSGVHYNLMCSGIGAIVTADSMIGKTHPEDDNILFFVPKCKESYRVMYLNRKYDSEDNPIIKNFIQTAKEVCARK